MTAVPQETLALEQAKDLVRLVVIGSVDDGKSTLIGRLLYETGALYDDQIEQVRRASKNGDAIDFSLFTDGLRAEREQGITIDVAYRYFETPGRKFILADTPGHAQYTRNMATGASTADAGIILLDARLGVLPQTRRHAAIAGRLGVRQLSFFPVSARHGDNVAQASARTPWHQGGTVLGFLESVEPARGREDAAFRFPVQMVLRPHLDYRGLAGQIASGSVAVGDEVIALPSGVRSRVRAIDTFEGPLPRAFAPMSVVLRLADEVDVGRGDTLAHPGAQPSVGTEVEATAVWLSERPLDAERAYLLKHTARTVPARVTAVRFRLDPETLSEVPAASLALNEVGRIALRCARPLAFDAYRQNRITGAFILIDALTNETAAAGTLLEARDAAGADGSLAALVVLVQREGEREALAAAHELEQLLWTRGRMAAVVRRPEAALACTSAGVVAIYPTGDSQSARALRDALRDSSARVIDDADLN
jgi:bifunctional enzyme CysN/CysC/sulfate adenylyltransferase subunit 1